jgi:hypothetical protein
MPAKYVQLNYSFVCMEAECGRQFEVPLHALTRIDSVVCPTCGASQDIRESKATGDIAQIMSALTTIEMARRAGALGSRRTRSKGLRTPRTVLPSDLHGN